MNKNIKGLTLIELLMAITIFLVVIALLVGVVSTCMTQTDNGTRIGTIVKFSHTGRWHKTWEGTMQIGGGTMQIENWDFTVIDDSVAEQVKSAMESGKRVAVEYYHVSWSAPWQAKTGYRVTSIKIISGDIK